MSSRELHSASADATQRMGRTLAPLLLPGDVISLTGDLGAGKTQFAKGAAAGLGVPENVASPTFNILVVHPGRLVLNHFDLYRLERADQLEDIDFYGVLESGGVSLIEWGDRFAGALPDDVLTVEIAIVGDDDRRLRVTGSGRRSRELLAAWADAVTADVDPGERP